jgi:hypothetical protein
VFYLVDASAVVEVPALEQLSHFLINIVIAEAYEATVARR